MNALFVTDKPAGISSNFFLSRLKRKYSVKKAGFSGTLDPFASGCLIVAFGDYTKFFRFLDKSPKVYKTTLWLGAKSDSFDNQNIKTITNLKPFDNSAIEMIVESLKGELVYTPPKFSAKKINGKRAYEMARNDEEFELKECKMNIYESNIINYSHPFLTILLSVSEGAYIRSYAELFSKKLGCDITLSALNRVSEGKFKYENEKFLNPIKYLNLKENFYLGDLDDVILGKKLNFKNFKFLDDGEFIVNLGEFYSIISVKNEEVKYLWNRIKI